MNYTSEWKAVNQVTGEVVDIDALQVVDGDHWEKVFVSELATMIGITGGGGAEVLAWLLRNKTKKNEVHGTQREISCSSGISLPTVNKVLRLLSANDFIRQVRCGYYIFNPRCLYFGNSGNKHAILKLWEMKE